MAKEVDVILLTKNSAFPCLKECLRSVYANVPVSRLLVVDGGSQDDTLQIVADFPRVVIIEDSKGNRATARQKGINAIETEWHLHVDSDVVLCKEWFSKASLLITPKVGAIWGAAIPMQKHIHNITRAMAKFYRKSIKDLAIQQPSLKRFLTHDTLIRTDALEGIKIPHHLHIWEDQYIGMHLVSKNYQWVMAKDPFCLHYEHERRGFNDFIQSGALAKKVGAYSTQQVLMRVSLAIPKALWVFAFTGDLKASKMQLENYIGLVKGWIGT
ncbi:glycosyltransferase family 2 protein [Candidatus Bathyarchaeota archaeon]|nr:glycosyltransferase family 2 protein [Candidatus Bathyarchaeota archaeon]